MSRLFHDTLLCAALATSVACGNSGSRTERIATRDTAAPLPGDAVALPLARIAGGTVEVLAGSTWRALGAGESFAGARGVRASGRGALIAIGDATAPAARLWLRADSAALLSQDADGSLYLAVEHGRVRAAASGTGTAVLAWSSGKFVDADDVLIERNTGRAEHARLLRTAEQPAQAAWSLAIESEPEAAGVGRLETTGSAGANLLALRRLDVRVKTHGGVAMTEIEHVFYNPSEQQLEGTFRFPVPDGAMVRGLAMEIDGRLMEGEIVEREKARRTYESIVDQMLDPALLEWEEGSWFKLRVFPIEARREKRVILRYATPLAHTVDGWEYSYTAASPEAKQTIGELTVTFDDKVIEHSTDVSDGKDVVVSIPDDRVPAVSREVVGGAEFTAVRIRPDWSRVEAGSRRATGRKMLVLVDTSRSSLDARALALEMLRFLLTELGEGDEFQIAAVDLEVRPGSDGFVAPSKDAITAAEDFIASIEPDGASNIEAALEYAGKSQATDVVYIGDGTPTWGTVSTKELSDIAALALPDAQLYAALLGKSASSDVWAELCGRVGGRAARPRTSLQARQLAFFVARADRVARIEGARVAPVDGASVFPVEPTTLFLGDEMLAIVRSDPGKSPSELTIEGRAGDRRFVHRVSLASARPQTLIAQQWASRQIAALDAAGDQEAQIVELSRTFGVLSRHTSLLVLESEEAYKQHEIERKNAETLLAQNADPQVTGADLESLSGRDPSLSPDQIQPGDPEIAIPAPVDARSVVVVFPFGETKLAEWDDERQAWMVRFLIDKDTPDGRYVVTVRITRGDGSVETLRLPYFVDTSAPEVELSVERRGPAYAIAAHQKKAARDVLKNDAARIEVVLPSGDILELSRTAPGKFEGEWTPDAPIHSALVLDVVVTDAALNQNTHRLSIPEAL